MSGLLGPLMEPFNPPQANRRPPQADYASGSGSGRSRNGKTRTGSPSVSSWL